MTPDDPLTRHVLDVAKIALSQLGLECSRSFEVVTDDELGHAALTVRLELTWLGAVFFGWCWPQMVESTIRKMHEVTSYNDVVLTVVVRLGLQ